MGHCGSATPVSFDIFQPMILGGNGSPCSDLDGQPAKQGLPVLPVNQKI